MHGFTVDTDGMARSLETRKVTLYFRGEFMGNIHKVEARAYKVETGKYAQYTNAVYLVYVGKGKRNARMLVQHFQPSLVVLDGWGHVDPPPMWGGKQTVSEDGTMGVWATHSSCSPDWQTDFNAVLDEHVQRTSAKVLHDFRNYKIREGL